MKVEIISREIVKPSSPTPHENMTYKLSFQDQFAPRSYVSILFFYPRPEKELGEAVLLNDHLRTSLSSALTRYYLLAGRVKDTSSVECNDSGATYVRARVDDNMFELIKKHDLNVTDHLLPCHPSLVKADIHEEPILAVQVNSFACGGVVIGVGILHVVADGSSVGSFVKHWAAIARGVVDGVEEEDAVVVDCTSIFPPRDEEDCRLTFDEEIAKKNPPIVSPKTIKRLVFEASKISALKENIKNGVGPSFRDCPISRIEALCALIWGAMITIAQEECKNQSTTKSDMNHVALNLVNLRKRLNPTLPTHCIGNIFLGCKAQWPLDKPVDYNLLAAEINQSIKMTNGDFVSRIREDMLGYVNNMLQYFVNVPHNRVIKFTSWCKFPFYECDFGFGKPVWIAPTSFGINDVLFLDASDGAGVEAYVAMPEDLLAKLEHNLDMLQYASFN